MLPLDIGNINGHFPLPCTRIRAVGTSDRQDWSFAPQEPTGNWMKKVQTLGDKAYYAPMDLPGEVVAGDE